MPSRLVFDHLPRTGGTSVRVALAAALGDNGHVPEVSWPHHAAIKSARERRLLAGHFWFFSGETLAPGWAYATLLRNPVDRVLSQYAFHRSMCGTILDGALAGGPVAAAVRLELSEYVECLSPYSNLQARHFASRVCDAPDGLNEPQLLQAAVASLGSYDVVGVFTDLQRFADTCADVLGVPSQPLPHLNAAPQRLRREEASSAVAETLAARNAVDTALYQWAQQRASAFSNSRAASAASRDWQPSRADFGSRQVQIISSHCEGARSRAPAVFLGERVNVRLTIRATVPVDDLTIGIAVRDQQARLISGTNTKQMGVPLRLGRDESKPWSFVIDAPAEPGEYWVTLAVHRGLSHEEGCFHWLENATSFQVKEP
jgi:Wzt-like putative exopolysaccharide export protein